MTSASEWPVSIPACSMQVFHRSGNLSFQTGSAVRLSVVIQCGLDMATRPRRYRGPTLLSSGTAPEADTILVFGGHFSGGYSAETASAHVIFTRVRTMASCTGSIDATGSSQDEDISETDAGDEGLESAVSPRLTESSAKSSRFVDATWERVSTSSRSRGNSSRLPCSAMGTWH